MGYTKLFNEIIMSTIWREPNHVRILWITMLALKDRWHVVSASKPGLADAAKISMHECGQGLKVLSSPDKYSRSQEHEGRRIEICDGGWLVLNGEKYRNKMGLDERREYQRLKQQEYRKRNKNVKSCRQKCKQFTHTDTDTDTDTDLKENIKEKPKRRIFKKPTVQELNDHVLAKSLNVDAEKFYYFYESKSWMIGKNKMASWKSALQTWHRNNKNHGSDKPTRAKRVRDRLEEIARQDIEENGNTTALD